MGIVAIGCELSQTESIETRLIETESIGTVANWGWAGFGTGQPEPTGLQYDPGEENPIDE